MLGDSFDILGPSRGVDVLCGEVKYKLRFS